jgi:hypothetical protein
VIFCSPISLPSFILIWAYFLEVYYQEQVAKRVKNSLTRITEPSVHVVLRRPYHINWFTNQIATCVYFFTIVAPSHRGLDFQVPGALGRRQRPLTSARARKDFPCTDRGTQLLVALPEYVLACILASIFLKGICRVAFHLRGNTLRAQLSQACASAGIPLPIPPTTPDFALHHSDTREMVSSR